MSSIVKGINSQEHHTAAINSQEHHTAAINRHAPVHEDVEYELDREDKGEPGVDGEEEEGRVRLRRRQDLM